VFLYRSLLGVLLLGELFYVRSLASFGTGFVYYLLSGIALFTARMATFARRGYTHDQLFGPLRVATADSTVLIMAYLFLFISVLNLPMISTPSCTFAPAIIAGLFLGLAFYMVRLAETTVTSLRTRRFFPKPLLPTYVLAAWFVGLGLPPVAGHILAFIEARASRRVLFASLIPANISLLAVTLFSASMAFTLWLTGGLNSVSRRLKLRCSFAVATYISIAYIYKSVSDQAWYPYVLSTVATICLLFSCATILVHLFKEGRTVSGPTGNDLNSETLPP
jgi:hypothetical protein